MPKILFKISHFPQVSETFVIAQIVTAIKCGFEAQILVKEFLDFKENGQDEVFKKYDLENKIIVENLRIPKNRILRLLKALFLVIQNIRDIAIIFQLINERKKFELGFLYEIQFYKKFRKIDIIHIQFGNNHQPFEILKKIGLIKSKLIVSFHGHDAFFPIHGFIQPGYYNTLFKHADLIITNTPYLEKQVASIGCPIEKLRSIPVGVDTNFFKPKYSKKRHSNTVKIITVGRLDKVKGHKYGIMIVEKLIQIGYKLKFTIIGDGEEMENLEKILVQKKLQNSINLVGKKNQLQVREYLRNSDIYMFSGVPVENGRRETQGLATLEAQACGLPIILFDSGGVKYTIDNGKTGFLIEEYDIEAMVEKMELLIKNSPLRKKMEKGAVNFVENNFSQKTINRLWCKTYNGLLNE